MLTDLIGAAIAIILIAIISVPIPLAIYMVLRSKWYSSHARKYVAAYPQGYGGLWINPENLWENSQKLRHAEDGLGNVSGLRYNTLIPTTKGNKWLI